MNPPAPVTTTCFFPLTVHPCANHAASSPQNAISIVVEYPIHLALKFRFRLPPDRAIKKYAARRRDASPNRPGTIGTQQRSGLCGAQASGSLTIDFHRGTVGRTYGQLPYLTLGSVVRSADLRRPIGSLFWGRAGGAPAGICGKRDLLGAAKRVTQKKNCAKNPYYRAYFAISAGSQ